MKHFSKSAILAAEKSFRRDFVNSLTGYKSLNLIGTISDVGVSNLAPFSQIIHVGASPPLIGILFRPHTVERHTLENIQKTSYFTLNHVTASFYKEAHHCSARWEGSEFQAVGLEEEYLEGFPAPFVKRSPLKIACELQEIQTLKCNGTELVVGSVEHVFVQESAVGQDGFISLSELGTVSVSGLDEYHVGSRLARLNYAKPGLPVTEM
ncbi:MAG: flavin reductase [Lunatimonas sp.]|uniref:flavin reductase family protein n=1 Tax=Lunatimonas sp. TaxID=2060141 RepID=UPI00263A9395|nr:flavin reductase [Lunatimonas sp.]MCC5936008.1 flavin reductase [Lunatimonas sp.]